MERRIRDLDTLAHEQLPNLRQAQTVPEPPLDGGAMVRAEAPSVAARTTTGGMEREQDLSHLLIADGGRHANAGMLRRAEIPAHRFWIEPELGGDPLLWQASPRKRRPL
jgi:hypothetical protein